VLCGCINSGQSQIEEEKEPHFLAGRGRVNAMDYHGAIECFNDALVANPHSAAAHFELGWLFEQKDVDPAAAIYHYERYLKLRANAADAETVKQRIFGLKQVLAQAVLPMPSTPGIQREMEQLMEENRRLRADLEKYKGAYAAGPTNAPAQPVRNPSSPRQTSPANSQPSASFARLDTSRASLDSSTSGRKQHKVESGESPSSIARRYGVPVNSLLQANPGLDPRRMRIGQVLNLPAS
jgi:LysM repeat protein